MSKSLAEQRYKDLVIERAASLHGYIGGRFAEAREFFNETELRIFKSITKEEQEKDNLHAAWRKLAKEKGIPSGDEDQRTGFWGRAYTRNSPVNMAHPDPTGRSAVLVCATSGLTEYEDY